MSDIVYRPPTAADTEALCQLGRDTFIETFGHLYSEKDLNHFLVTVFGPEGMPVEMKDPGLAFLVAEDAGQLVGYCKVGTLYTEVEGIDPTRRSLELRQLYVRRSHHGHGVAQALMDWGIEELRRRGAEDVYLSVYSDNHRAQKFYARYGFVEVGRNLFMVGDQADDDRIWKLSLSEPAVAA
jgi:ribosomal protein S18 acetylase RimI-like enzyme